MKDSKGRFTRGNPGRPKGAKNKRSPELAEFCRNVLESETYRRKFTQRLIRGTASSAEVKVAYEYGYGKPVTTIDMNLKGGDVSIEDLLSSATPQERAAIAAVAARMAGS